MNKDQLRAISPLIKEKLNSKNLKPNQPTIITIHENIRTSDLFTRYLQESIVDWSKDPATEIDFVRLYNFGIKYGIVDLRKQCLTALYNRLRQVSEVPRPTQDNIELKVLFWELCFE